MHLKDKISKNVVYSMNIHQVCGKNTKKHALKETILQNINQTRRNVKLAENMSSSWFRGKFKSGGTV